MKKINPTATDFHYLTRKEVASLLKISMPTLHDWTKQGWLNSYKVGSRVFYKSNEIDEAIVKRKHRRYW